jgi:hypothetical protein
MSFRNAKTQKFLDLRFEIIDLIWQIQRHVQTAAKETSAEAMTL